MTAKLANTKSTPTPPNGTSFLLFWQEYFSFWFSGLRTLHLIYSVFSSHAYHILLVNYRPLESHSSESSNNIVNTPPPPHRQCVPLITKQRTEPRTQPYFVTLLFFYNLCAPHTAAARDSRMWEANPSFQRVHILVGTLENDTILGHVLPGGAVRTLKKDRRVWVRRDTRKAKKV